MAAGTASPAQSVYIHRPSFSAQLELELELVLELVLELELVLVLELELVLVLELELELVLVHLLDILCRPQTRGKNR